MDTSAEPIVRAEKSRAGVRTRKRRLTQEKLQIVRETMQSNVSVAVIARRHGVNANRIASERTLKCLAIVDDATHEVIAVRVEHHMGGNHLTRILDGICSQRGRPVVIRSDNR